MLCYDEDDGVSEVVEGCACKKRKIKQLLDMVLCWSKFEWRKLFSQAMKWNVSSSVWAYRIFFNNSPHNSMLLKEK